MQTATRGGQLAEGIVWGGGGGGSCVMLVIGGRKS